MLLSCNKFSSSTLMGTIINSISALQIHKDLLGLFSLIQGQLTQCHVSRFRKQNGRSLQQLFCFGAVIPFIGITPHFFHRKRRKEKIRAGYYTQESRWPQASPELGLCAQRRAECKPNSCKAHRPTALVESG
jgi:hypothetical protein